MAARLLLALLARSCRGGAGRRAGLPTTAARRARADEGAPTVRLYLVTDLAGALEPCGCTKDQLGGLESLRRLGEGASARSAPAARSCGGPLFFMDPQLERRPRRPGPHQGRDHRARRCTASGFVALRAGPERLGRRAPRASQLRRERAACVARLGRGRRARVGAARGGRRQGRLRRLRRSGPAPRRRGRRRGRRSRRAWRDAKKQGAEVLIAPRGRRAGRGQAHRRRGPRAHRHRRRLRRSRRATRTPRRPPGRAGRRRAHRAGGQPPAERRGARPVRARAARAGARRPLRRRHGPRAVSQAGGPRAAHRRAAHEDRRVGARPQGRPGRRRRAPRRAREAGGAARRARHAPAARPGQLLPLRREGDARARWARTPRSRPTCSPYYKAVDDHNRVAFADRVPPPAAPDAADATSASRRARPATRSRARSGTARSHSRAYATLAPRFKEFNLECVSCHVTGYEQPGGSTVTTSTC